MRDLHRATWRTRGDARLIETVAFDADDTLWESEVYFARAQTQVAELLEMHANADEFSKTLLRIQLSNLGLYGVGAKGFMVSAIEATIAVAHREISGELVHEIIKIGQELLEHPVSFCAYAEETIARLCGQFRLLLITKGDSRDQERKIALSGVADFFDGIEIVADKSRKKYEEIFAKYGATPARTMMVGNSVKSDIVPVLDAGGWASLVPHPLTWPGEHHAEPVGHSKFLRAESLLQVPGLIEQASANTAYGRN